MVVLGWALMVEDLHSIQKDWGSVSSRASFSSHVRVCICTYTHEYICRGLTVLPGFCCSEFYEANALMMEEEGAIIAGLLVGLNVIDANFCMKGEDLDSQVWEILP